MYFLTSNPNLRLLGSMHMVPASDPKIPDWAQSAYDWSECLVFESELGPESLSYFVAQDSIPLALKLSPAVHAGLSGLWTGNRSLPALDSLRPWGAAVLSASTLSPCEPGIEPIFLDWATEDGKLVDYLESASAFPALADAIPIETVDRTLAAMLADLESARKSQLNLHRAWATGNIAAFEKLANQAPLLREPEIKSAVLDLRNEAWAPKLQALMKCRTRTLVAVGALHLLVHPSAQEFAGIDLQLL